MKRFRGLTPWPGVFLESGLKILEMELVETTSCYEKVGVLHEIQKEGVVFKIKRLFTLNAFKHPLKIP